MSDEKKQGVTLTPYGRYMVRLVWSCAWIGAGLWMILRGVTHHDGWLVVIAILLTGCWVSALAGDWERYSIEEAERQEQEEPRR